MATWSNGLFLLHPMKSILAGELDSWTNETVCLMFSEKAYIGFCHANHGCALIPLMLSHQRKKHGIWNKVNSLD
jgi:hypothetical protein